MATSLASQLSVIAARSDHSLNLKAQKARHSKSLIYEPRTAASQNFETIYNICHEGFQELCLLDHRFIKFQNDLFNEQSLEEDRSQMTAAQNAELDEKLHEFLSLVSQRLRLAPAIKAVEWLVRRYRIHESNTSITLLTFLPYHTLPIFTTLMSILPANITEDFKFLQPYIRSLTNPPRNVIVKAAVASTSFASAFNNFIVNLCKVRYEYASLLAFWAGIMTEATACMFDRAQSGRRAVQIQAEQDVVLRVLPMLKQGLVITDVPNLRIGCLMQLSVIVSKGSLDNKLITAMMEAIAISWTDETATPCIICLSLLAEHRGAIKLTKKLLKQLTKVSDFMSLLVKISKQQRVDKLAIGVCLSILDRLRKTGSSDGLSLIEKMIESNLLTNSQVITVFKSLLSIANQLNDAQSESRSQLARLLVILAELPGNIGSSIRATICETKIDMDELELKLKVSIRPTVDPKLSSGNDLESSNDTQLNSIINIEAILDQLTSKTNGETSFLTQESSQTYLDLSHAFIVCNSKPEYLKKFDETPILQRNNANKNPLYLSFYMRTWCSPVPVNARVSALQLASLYLRSSRAEVDFQMVIPYAISALSDPAIKVRRGAANLLSALGSLYSPATATKESKSNPLRGIEDIYGLNTKGLSWLSTSMAARFVNEILVPSLEECVLDKKHILSVFQNLSNYRGIEISQKNSFHSSKSLSVNILQFLTCQTIKTPIFIVKLSLLACANQIRGIGSTTKFKHMFPVLQNWVALNKLHIIDQCQNEQLNISDLEEQFLLAITHKPKEGIRFLLSLIRDQAGHARPTLEEAIYNRIKTLWPSLSEDVRRDVAEALLAISMQTPGNDESKTRIHERTVTLLHQISLSTEILLYFINTICSFQNLEEKLTEEPPVSKKRRTSYGEVNTSHIKDPSLIKAIIWKVTFILQLVDDSEPEKHPRLLGPLFNVLAELLHLKSTASSELSYLQSLVLGCILATLKSYEKANSIKIDDSVVRADLLVDCIQMTTSLQVQSAALLVVSSLAHIIPQLVLHSVMPIFTFMGNSILQQSDEYSAHVINQTIRKVIPPLMASLRLEKGNPTVGASELLLSFVTAYEHVPSHRRKGLYLSLVQTLGPEDFIFALFAMLLEKYGYSNSIKDFAIQIFEAFTVEIQLQTTINYIDLVADIIKPSHNHSSLLLNINDESGISPSEVALKELLLLPDLLSQTSIVSQIGKLLALDDMDAVKSRQLYSNLVEQLLVLSDTVKEDKSLSCVCGDILESTLGLISTNEFLKSIRNLLERPNESLRRKILRSLETRIENEKCYDSCVTAAILNMLPYLTVIIRESGDISYKYIAVSCIRKISKKYGKKDLEAVGAAVETIASNYCLGHSDNQLRVIALQCLASIIEALREGIISILPVAVPKALEYLKGSIKAEERAQSLHRACYSFLYALTRYLPYMISRAHLNEIFERSNVSAEAQLDFETHDSRNQFLTLAAKQINPKNFLSSLQQYWPHAMSLGPSALREKLDCLRVAINHNAKGEIIKNSSLIAEILKNLIDFRRHSQSFNTHGFTSATVNEIEQNINAVILEVIYKLNDATFRPIFMDLVDWTALDLQSEDNSGRLLRKRGFYSFTTVFFENLKSIVTNYATYLLKNAVETLSTVNPKDESSKELWSQILRTLTKSFEHDQDDFWQSPTQFNTVAPILCAQFVNATNLPLVQELIPAIVEFASVSDSPDHHKQLNTSILLHVRSENASVRLAAVICEQKLTEKLGEEWLSMLPEMLPVISELQEDDDEVVEKETHRWIVKIEEVLGESLDSMLN